VVLGEDVLQHHDAGGAGLRVAAVVADVALPVPVVVVLRVIGVFVDVGGAVGVAVEAAHQPGPGVPEVTGASSRDTTANSSPVRSATSRLKQSPQATMGMSSVVSTPQARQETVAGTLSISRTLPSRSVPVASICQLKVR